MVASDTSGGALSAEVPGGAVEGLAERSIEISDDITFEADHEEVIASDVGELQLTDKKLSAQIGIFQKIVAKPASLEEDAALREVVDADVEEAVGASSSGDGCRHAAGVVGDVGVGVGGGDPDDG